MERRIIIYSFKSNNVCCFILALISLIPGCNLFGLNINKELHNFNNCLNEYGLPLEVFNNKSKLFPLFTLYDLDSLDSSSGYLIGTTNKIVSTNKKINADVVVNIDTCSFEFSEKSKNYTTDKLITKKEKEIYNKINKELNCESDNKEINNKILTSQDNWMISDSDSYDNVDDLIRNEFKNYFYNMLSDLSLIQHLILNKEHEKEIQELTESNLLHTTSSNKNNIENDFGLQGIDKNKESNINNNNLYHYSNITNNNDNNEDSSVLVKPRIKFTFPKQVSTHSTYELDEGENIEKTIKKIINLYNVDFLNLWSTTYNFKLFVLKHNPNISFISSFIKYASNVNLLYENGESYLGEVCYGKRHGIGTLTEIKDNKIFTYNGSFVNDKKNGTGTITSDDGLYVYDGEFVDDIKEGEGQLLFNKSRYSGNFKNNEISGNGIYCDSEGNVYEGEFIKGKYHGFGQLTLNNEDVYIGQFIDGEYFGKGLLRKGIKINSKSSIKDMNEFLTHREEIIDNSLKQKNFKEIYDGDFVANKKCGEGIFMDDKFLKGDRIDNTGKHEKGYIRNEVFVLIDELLGIDKEIDENDNQKNIEENVKNIF